MERFVSGSVVRWRWFHAAVVLAVSSAALGFFMGPKEMAGASMGGLLVAGLGLYLCFVRSDQYPPRWIMAGAVVIHIVLLGGAVFLQRFFLSALPSGSMIFPPLSHTYLDPGKRFRVRGPEHWDYTPIDSSFEQGVLISPGSRGAYMGVSEVRLYLKQLDEAPASKEEALSKMAAWADNPRTKGDKEKKISFSVDPVDLLNGEKGLFAVLEAKRFWVPVRQVTLFGIKRGRTLVTVTAVGLASHAVLAKVLCLGLFEKTVPLVIPSN